MNTQDFEKLLALFGMTTADVTAERKPFKVRRLNGYGVVVEEGVVFACCREHATSQYADYLFNQHNLKDGSKLDIAVTEEV